LKLSANEKKFVKHFGKLAPRYDIKPAVLEVLAVLHLKEDPLNADELAKLTGLSAGQARHALHTLQDWAMVEEAEVIGERRKHYACELTIWEIMRNLMLLRKHEDFDPTLDLLRACTPETPPAADARHEDHRLYEVREFFEIMGVFYEEMESISPERMERYARLGSKATKFATGHAPWWKPRL